MLACSALVVLHLLVAHHHHAVLAHAGARAAHAVERHAAPVADMAAHLRVGHAEVTCPLPSVVAPRISPLLLGALAAVLVTLVVVLAMSVMPAVSSRPWPPRPPGPTRQALLQRFTL